MRKQSVVTAVAAVATAAALGLGGAALAQASTPAGASVSADGGSTASPSTPTAADQDQRRGPGPGRPGLKDRVMDHGLTGETAVKVTQAAVAKEPTAYLLRVGKAEDGTFRAHMMRPDGTRIILTIDGSFAVTGVQDAPLKAPGANKPDKQTRSGATATTTPSTTS